MVQAVCYEFGKPLVIKEVTSYPPQTGEVTVMIAASASCQSVIHLVRGEWGGRAVVGSLMGETRASIDLPHLVELDRPGWLKLDKLISGRYPLEAIEPTERSEALRHGIVF